MASTPSFRDAIGPRPDDLLATLPNGAPFVMRRPYSPTESRGVLVLAVVSCISATSVFVLLTALAVSAFNTRRSRSQNLFLRSHVAAYFIFLLLCDLSQTVGSIMSIRWVMERAVSYDSFCTAQAAVKQIADVGTAFWSTIIAMNTFWILFLQWKLRRIVLIVNMLGGWFAIAALITAGPTSIQKVQKGPFYAISGYWCWVSDEYPTERITLDYLIMFLSALFSFIMYALIFLKLRGNISVHGWHLSFHFHGDPSRTLPGPVDSHVVSIAKKMLLYPVAYTILLLPIAACRFAEWTGHEVPFGATILSDSIFLLSGFVNVVLFFTTRHVLPINSILPPCFSRFIRPSTSAASRLSNYTATSYTTDAEKSPAYSDAPLLPVPGPAPTHNSAGPTSPVLAIGYAPNSEVDRYISTSSAEAERSSLVQEVDIANPRLSPYRVAHR